MGFVRLTPRQWPLEQDAEKREDFQKRLAKLNAEDVEVWYSDECGVQGDPKPRRIWARKGSRPRVGFKGTHIKENVVGAVRECDGKFVSLVLPEMNASLFQLFLDEMQKWIGRKRVVMIIDNATWHKAKALDWGRIEPMYLPPYSPDLNPIERIWLDLKEKFFSTFTARDWIEHQDRLVTALRYYIFNPSICKSICKQQK